MKFLKKNNRIINSLLKNFDDSDADRINTNNEKILSKELKNIIKKNNKDNNITGSGSVLKRKPIDTTKLTNCNCKK